MLHQRHKVYHYCETNTDTHSIAPKITRPACVECLEDDADRIERKTQIYERQSKLPNETESQFIKRITVTILTLDYFAKCVFVCSPIHNQIHHQQDSPQCQERCNRHGDKSEVIWKIEKHVYSFHRIRRSRFLEIVIYIFEVEYACQISERKETAEHRIDGIEERKREVCKLHDSYHLKSDIFASSKDKRSEKSQQGYSDNRVCSIHAYAVSTVYLGGVQICILIIVGDHFHNAVNLGGKEFDIIGRSESWIVIASIRIYRKGQILVLHTGVLVV